MKPEPYQITPREAPCLKKECCKPDEQYFHIPEEDEPDEDEEE